MNGQGLAGASQPMVGGSGQGMGQGRQIIDEVKAMLMNGATPEELISKGIPQEIIVQAIHELEQEMGSQQPEMQEQPVTQPGLAAQGMM